MPELLYTVKDVAKLLKTNEDYVRKLIKKGYLKAMVLGRLKAVSYTHLTLPTKLEV